MTQSNRFRPPEAVTADFNSGMPRASRPISAWLLEALLMFLLLASVAGSWRLAWSIALDWQVRSMASLLLSIMYQACSVAVLSTALWGIHRGRSWSRWLGLAILVGLVVFSLVRHDESVYPNEAQRAGAELAGILMPLLFAWWGWAFAFSAKAKRYFAPPTAVAT